jgi:hypothetical protein
MASLWYKLRTIALHDCADAHLPGERPHRLSPALYQQPNVIESPADTCLMPAASTSEDLGQAMEAGCSETAFYKSRKHFRLIGEAHLPGRFLWKSFLPKEP